MFETREDDVFADAGVGGAEFDGLHEELEEKTETALPELVLGVGGEFNKELHLRLDAYAKIKGLVVGETVLDLVCEDREQQAGSGVVVVDETNEETTSISLVCIGALLQVVADDLLDEASLQQRSPDAIVLGQRAQQSESLRQKLCRTSVATVDLVACLTLS